MLRKVLWILLPLTALVGLWVWSTSRPVPVDVATIGRSSIRAFVEEEGKTRVVERYLVSAPVGGRLQRVDLEAGDVVEASQVVARIDALPYEAEIARAEAEVRALKERITGVATKQPKAEEIERAKILETQAEEALEVAGRELDRAHADHERLVKDLERARVLAERKLVPASELDAAIATEAAAHEQVRAQEVRIKIARLAIAATTLNRTAMEDRLDDFDWEALAYAEQVKALEAALRKLRDDLAHTAVTTPVRGTVLRRILQSEQIVTAGMPILEIGDVGNLEVEADFLSEDAAHMRPGMPVEIFGRALGDRILTGRLDRIHPSAFEKISSLGVEQQRVKVVVVFEAGAAAAEGLGDLFRVEVRVILETRAEATLVPEGALFRLRGDWCVFIVADGHARLRRVATGLRDGRVREVLEGLSPGERVVLHPGDALEDGAQVEALPGSEA